MKFSPGKDCPMDNFILSSEPSTFCRKVLQVEAPCEEGSTALGEIVSRVCENIVCAAGVTLKLLHLISVLAQS